MAFSAVRSLQKTSLGGVFSGVPQESKTKRCSSTLPCSAPGKSRNTRLPVQASKGLPWVSDEEVVFGGFQKSGGLKIDNVNKRDVRVGAKWLRGLKGDSKSGGTGSSGSTLFERVGEVDDNQKSSTAATAVGNFGGRVASSENGRANVMVDDDFDEDAYTEEEEDDDDADEDADVDARLAEESEENASEAQEHLEVAAATAAESQNGAAHKEQTSEEPASASKSSGETLKIAQLRMGLNAMQEAMDKYFKATFDVGRLMPLEQRKAFVAGLRQEKKDDIKRLLEGDKDNLVVELEGEERELGTKLLTEYADALQGIMQAEADKMEKEQREFTLFNGRIVEKTPDIPTPPPAELSAFIQEAMANASLLGSQPLLDLARPSLDSDEIANFPFPLDPNAFADVDSEEELRQKVAEQKLMMYSEAQGMRQELLEQREVYQRVKEAAEREAEQAGQNGRPSSWPEWRDSGDRFGGSVSGLNDYDVEQDFQRAERVIQGFEAEIESRFHEYEKSLGLRPQSDKPGQMNQQDYLDFAASIEKVREGLEEGLQADDAQGVAHLKKPVAESDFAAMEQTYRELIENGEQAKAAGQELPPGAFQAMDSLSAAIGRLEELVAAGRIEVVRDRDYLDALRAYMAAREDGSDTEDSAFDRPPVTPSEVLEELEASIASLDYTLAVLSDDRPLSPSEIVEMQIMDEGLVSWRDDILGRITTFTQVSALATLDSLVNRVRPYYMVGLIKPLTPFEGFRDPNTAAVTNAWANLIGDQEPIPVEQAVTSAWDALLGDDSTPSGGEDSTPAANPPGEEPQNGSARASENGAAERFEEPTTSAKMDNVMTLGGIQLDLDAAQADRLSSNRSTVNAGGSDPP